MKLDMRCPTLPLLMLMCHGASSEGVDASANEWLRTELTWVKASKPRRIYTLIKRGYEWTRPHSLHLSTLDSDVSPSCKLKASMPWQTSGSNCKATTPCRIYIVRRCLGKRVTPNVRHWRRTSGYELKALP